MRITRKQSHIILVLFATKKIICCNAARCKTVEDINPPKCNFEDLKDEVLVDICKSIGYQYNPNGDREELAFVAGMCHNSVKSLVKDRKEKKMAQQIVYKRIDESLRDDKLTRRLHLDYLDMMKDTSFVSRSRHDRISYLLSKHGIDDVERKATIRELLLAKLEDYVLTPEEIDSRTRSLIEKLEANDEVKPTAEKCKTAADINPPTCNIEDLEDEILISICSWAGYNHKPNPTRKQLVKGAQLCFKIQAISPIDFDDNFSIQPLSPMISEQLDEVLQYIENQVNEDVVLENAIIESLYLDYQDMMKDSRFFKTKRHAILSNLLSKRGVDDEEEWLTLRKSFLETFDEAELEQSNRLSYGPTAEEIAKLPKWEDRHEVISLGDWYVRAFQKEGKVITAQWSATSQTWTRPTKITELEYKNGDGMYWWNGINALEFVRKSIQYDHASVFRTGGGGIQKKSVLIGYNYGDDPFVTAKRIVDEHKLSAFYIYSITRVLQESEEIIRQKTGVPPTKAKKRSDSGDKPTPEEIANLPKWQLNKQFPGFYEGQMKMMQKDGSVVQTMWSATSQWTKPIKLTESHFAAQGLAGGEIDILDFIRTEIRNDHVLQFALNFQGGSKQQMIIGYNYGDDPHAVAQGVIDKYMLDEKYLSRIADSIIQTIERHGGRFTHPPKWSYYMTRVSDYIQEMKRNDYLVLVILAAVVYFGGVVIILMIKGEKTGENRQFTKKTVYVKSSAIKRLNRGNRLNGILTRSGVQYIDFERKIGQPTAMYKIKATNGEVYVPLNIKGREEAIEKAAVLIQEAVGKENFNEEIELPPTNRKQATTAAPPVSLSAPTRIPLKKKKEPPSSTLWQSLYGLVGKTGSNEYLVSVLVSVLYIIYYPTLPKDCIDIANPEMCKFFAYRDDCQDGLDPFAALSGITKDNCRLSCNACYIDRGISFRVKVVLTQFFATFIQMILLCIAIRAICGSCSGQSFISTLRLNTTKAYQSATSHIKVSCSSVAVIVVLYTLLFCIVYFECALFHTDKAHLSCNVQTYEVAFVALLNLLTTFPVLLCSWLVAKYMQLTEAEIFVFGGLCFVFLFRILFDFKGQVKFVAKLLLVLVLGVIILLWRRLRPLSFIARILRMPFEMYQAKKIKQTIYIKSSQSKNLSGKQDKEKKEIVNKSGVDNIQIHSAFSDDYIPIHIAGSRRSVREAIELIREDIGTEHVSTTKPSQTVAPTLSDRITNFLYRWSEGGEDERAPNRNADVPCESETTGLVDVSNGPEPLDEGGDDSNNTPESPVQPETMSNNDNNLNKEVSTTESLPAKAVQEEEEVPSEIGIDSSQGMTTRETITEASMSSLNDRSNASKAYSSFTLDEDDPLLIFLRSQASCIKGSVDEFYTWLVKSEDIDSMLALKEAVNEDDYLNDMKVGDGGGSGIKGFKRKAFLRAISEYFNDESDTKSTVEEPQSLPQCQMKNLSETLEPPEELVCPISLNLMTNDPVVAADGITYERASIEDWFKKSKAKITEAQENLKQNPHSEADQRVVNNGICSPVYGTKMENLALVPNTSLRNVARTYK